MVFCEPKEKGLGVPGVCAGWGPGADGAPKTKDDPPEGGPPKLNADGPLADVPKLNGVLLPEEVGAGWPKDDTRDGAAGLATAPNPPKAGATEEGCWAGAPNENGAVEVAAPAAGNRFAPEVPLATGVPKENEGAWDIGVAGAPKPVCAAGAPNEKGADEAAAVGVDGAAPKGEGAAGWVFEAPKEGALPGLGASGCLACSVPKEKGDADDAVAVDGVGAALNEKDDGAAAGGASVAAVVSSLMSFDPFEG